MPFVPDSPATGRFVPDAPPTPPAQGDEGGGVMDALRGAGEVALGGATSAVVAPAANLYAAGKELIQGRSGSGQAEREAGALTEKFAGPLQPKTPTGQRYAQNIGEAFDRSGLAGLGPITDIAAAASMAPAAVKQMSSTVGKAAGGVVDKATAGRKLAAAEHAPVADTARLAGELDIKVPPQELSLGKSGLVGHTLRAMTDKEALAANFALHNNQRGTTLLRADLDIPRGVALTKAVFQENIAREGKAYEAVRSVPYRLDLKGPYQDEIRNIGGAYADAARKYVETHGRKNLDPLIEELAAGESSPIVLPNGRRASGTMSPSDAIDNIRRLRERASSYLDATNADPTARDMGLAFRDAAKALENMVASNLEDHGERALFDQFQKSRVKIAKNHDAMDALHEPSGTFDLTLYGKLFDHGDKMSDNAAKLGRLAAAYPDYFLPAWKASGRTTGSHKTSFGVLTEMAGPQAVARKLLGSRKLPARGVPYVPFPKDD